ncbi:hypothetical protein KDA_14840 [Dictyobacter alpinus]|uniref:FmdB family transcriptional regulator n=2 Tax=Dictyobacter alpinus TaxID=2014873 RepID=A0A402B3R8_9CHLR|nr:hypothetical protein KDA_14840 [Dictyobacter alpinus]
MTDEPLTVCPECGQHIRRVLFPAGVVFKGSGFYKTDYSNGKTLAPSNGDTPKTESGSESKPSTESKSSDSSSGTTTNSSPSNTTSATSK